MATESSEGVESASSLRLRSALRTFLIADVRGYTKFTVDQGNEAAARLAATFAAIARAVVAARDGEVVELRGDEALAVFSSARQALYAAVELQDHFREHTEVDPTLPLKVGIGIDAGEAVPVEGGYRGLPLNLAARLCALAGPGEAYGSEGVIQRAQKLEGLAYVERGRVSLKGFSDPIRVIQILPEDDLPAGFPPLVPLVAKPSNLPLQPTPFIGREREVEAVTSLLRRPEVRLLTVTGAGGTGKTRLALQVGGAVLEDFEWGVFFVSLAPLTDPSLIPSSIADILKVKEAPGKTPVETLCDHLRDKRLLLVLDNFEHLLEGAPAVSELLAVCPDLKVLVTSRAVLHLSGEHDYPVPPLSVPDPQHLPEVETLSQYDAVALFIQRAQAARPDFAVTDENALAVAEICHRLDGLPLAIELAATRIRLLPPQALLARLSRRLRLLTGGAKDAPARQQTLRATIDWSYGLLDEGEQMLFARLSIFQGGCTLEAVEAVCDPEGDRDVLERLAVLVEQSLLEQVGEDEPRFSMLETIREYAAERMQASDQAKAVRERYAAYYLGLAEEAEPELVGAQQARWLHRLEAEHDNLRAALERLLAEQRAEEALRLAGTLWQFWSTYGHYSEGRRWLKRVLAVGGEGWKAARAKALDGAGFLAFHQGDCERATALFGESLALFRELGDLRGVANVLNGLGNVALTQGDYERAPTLYGESLALRRELGDTRGIAASLANLGIVAETQAEYERATTLLDEALALFRELGATWNVAHSLGFLGLVAYSQGEHERAARHCGESLALARELGHSNVAVEPVEILGYVETARGRPERAARLWGAADAWREAKGEPPLQFWGERHERTVAEARKQLDEAAWAAAWDEGRAMSLEEAVAHALGESA